jgi:hypothetical protein
MGALSLAIAPQPQPCRAGRSPRKTTLRDAQSVSPTPIRPPLVLVGGFGEFFMSTGLPGTGFINRERAPAELPAVKQGNRPGSLLFRLHLNEGKALGQRSDPVDDQVTTDHGAGFFEQVQYVFFPGSEWKIPDIEFGRHW